MTTPGAVPPAAPPPVPPPVPPPWDPSADAPTGPLLIPPSAPAIGRGPRPDRPGIGWTEIGVAVATYVVLQLVLGGAVVAVLAALGTGLTPSAPLLVALSAVAAFGAVGLAIVVRVRSAAALGLRRVSAKVVAATIGIGLAVWVGSRLLSLAWIAISGDTTDPQGDLRFTGGASTVVMLVLAGIVVPCGEELLFRGVIFGGLRRHGLGLATAASALVFGLAHGFNAVLPAAALLGLANCLLYERTRSVVPAMMNHMMFNLLSLGAFLLLS